jgi:diacylglycerol kinase (ATP)
MKRVLFVINPRAGRGTLDLFEHALHQLQKMQKTSAVSEQEKTLLWERLSAEGEPDTVRTLLRERLRHETWDAVAVVGGDGTLMELLPVLVEFSQVPLALIPAGTGNLLAANLGIPKDIFAALQLLVSGQSRRIDVVRMDASNYFVVVAGVGVVADIMHNTPRHHKKWFGSLAYLLHGLRILFRVRGSRFIITTESRRVRIRAMAVLVSNAASFLGPCLSLTPDADPLDGWLDVCLVKGRSVADCLPLIVELLQPDWERVHPQVVRFRAQRVRIESTPPLKVQADGNILGMTPVEMEIIRGGLQILVPAAALSQSTQLSLQSTVLNSIRAFLGV